MSKGPFVKGPATLKSSRISNDALMCPKPYWIFTIQKTLTVDNAREPSTSLEQLCTKKGVG